MKLTQPNKNKSKKWRLFLDKSVNIVSKLAIVAFLWFLIQVFFIASFRIPSDSMSPGLISGDHVLVWKPTLGARVFNLYASMKHEQVNIYRLPGIRKIKHNDILVFNSPYSNRKDKIEMNILKYYIKRCVALPGDTFSIQNGSFRIHNNDQQIGNGKSQEVISLSTNKEFIYNSNIYPSDSIIQWNLKNFGPLYIPRKGDVVKVDRKHFVLYRNIIEWELQTTLQYQDSVFFHNGKALETYCFQNDYYFMCGDNCSNSEDSRFWGLLPEDYIVGKAWIIWMSVERKSKYFRKERFLKPVN